MKKYILFISTLFAIHQLDAQSLPMYSQYMYNMLNINPAYAGERVEPNLTALWREQWVGLPGSPTTKSLSYDWLTNNKKYGLGVQFFDDRYVNSIKRTGLNLIYNLKVQVSDKGMLSMGMKGGFYNDVKSLSNTNMGTTGVDASGDPAFAKNLNKMIPLAGAGLFYSDDKMYLGFSVPDLITFSNVKDYNADKALYQVNEIHYFLTGGYSFDLNDELSIKPSFLLKAVSGAPIEYDLNTNFWFKNMLGLGASYRKGQSYLGMAEIQVTPQIRFGYAYDMPFKRPNSHEFFLRYEIGRLFPKLNTYKID